MAFVKVGKQWVNDETVTHIVAGGDGQVSVHTSGSGKFSARGEEAEAILKALGVDKKEFFASVPAPVATQPVDWLTTAQDETAEEEETEQAKA